MPFFAAAVGVIPPGLINLSLGKAALVYGLKSSCYQLLGILLVTLIQGIASSVLAFYFPLDLKIQGYLLKIALCFLVLLLLFFLYKISKGKDSNTFTIDVISTSQDQDYKTLFLKGIGISAVNFLPIPYFWMLSHTAFHQVQLLRYYHNIIFGISVTLGVFSVLAVYMYVFTRYKNKISNYLHYFNWVMFLIISCSIVITVLRM